MEYAKQVTVIIRSAGERTENLCKKCIAAQQIPAENIFIIREKPFSEAMRRGYQTGIDQNRPWTLIVDADVLLRNGSVDKLLKTALNASDDVMLVSGKLLDKLFGDVRRAGNHLFRTSRLRLMLKQIPPYEQESIRPESSVIKILQQRGHKWLKTDEVIGLHDYEQHYHDLARKAYVHARKHTEYISELTEFWIRKSEKDPDYRAALIGLAGGIRHFGEIKINTDDFEELKSEVQEILGKKTESQSIVKDEKDIEKIIEESSNRITVSAVFQKKYDDLFNSLFRIKSYKQIISRLFKKVKSDAGRLVKRKRRK